MSESDARFRHRLLTVAEEHGPTQADILVAVYAAALRDVIALMRAREDGVKDGWTLPIVVDDDDNYHELTAIDAVTLFAAERGIDIDEPEEQP